jgi:hypothetical protein
VPDPYAVIDQQDMALQECLAGVLELRAAAPAQRAILDAYLADLDLPSGCGRWRSAVGREPSPAS